MLNPNVYGEVTQIMLGRDMAGTVFYWTAAYLVDGLLIDTGCSYTAAELEAFLRDKQVEMIVNTHHHEDHVGGNYKIKEARGSEIYAHPLAVPLISRRPRLRQYQELVWGYPEPSAVKPVPGTIRTPRFVFQVLETPGHCPDHISLFEPERGWCFCGDLFVSETQKVFRTDEDIYSILASLRLLHDLPAERLILFTSIGRVFPEGREAIGAFLAHIDRIAEKVIALAGRGMTLEEIRDEIFGRESRLAELTGSHYSILNLIRGLLAPC